ncbi:MAG: hypothetical protein V1816_15695 [Pseudomonadota bacterium]
MEKFSAKNFRKNHRRPTTALRRTLELLGRLVPPAEGETPALARGVDRAAELAHRLADRLDLGPEAPLFIPLLGGTGAGKSKLFNSLAGYPASPSGFRRPTTMAPVLLASERHLPRVARPDFFPGYLIREASEEKPIAFQPEGPPEIILLKSRATDDRPLILADAPDFDSVLAPNRQAAADLFDRSDAVIIAADAVKYADQVIWDYLDRVKKVDKPAILVINRVKNPLPAEDFQKRLDRAGLGRRIISIPDQAALGDEDLFPPDLPALVELRLTLADWLARREDLLAEEAWKTWTGLDAELASLLADLQTVNMGLELIQQGLRRAADEVTAGLADNLGLAISGELKNTLVLQVQALFLRWDLLRQPRRIMALPFTLLRDKVLAPLGILGEDRSSGRTALESEVDRLFEANRETMVRLTADFNLAAGELFAAAPAGRGLRNEKEFEGLAMSPDLTREKYREVRADLEAWVGERSRELAGNLKLGEKMTFYLAQVVSLGLFISIQVHTGGGFSFFDGLIDTALAPILSKITGSALSRDKVKAFEEEATRKHQEGCRGLIRDQAQAYLDFLARAGAGLSAASDLAAAFKTLQKEMETLS